MRDGCDARLYTELVSIMFKLSCEADLVPVESVSVDAIDTTSFFGIDLFLPVDFGLYIVQDCGLHSTTLQSEPDLTLESS